MDIYRCTFSKNVCMPSGAGFVKTVTMAALSAFGLSVEIQGFVKKGAGNTFLIFVFYFWDPKKM